MPAEVKYRDTWSMTENDESVLLYLYLKENCTASRDFFVLIMQKCKMAHKVPYSLCFNHSGS